MIPPSPSFREFAETLSSRALCGLSRVHEHGQSFAACHRDGTHDPACPEFQGVRRNPQQRGVRALRRRTATAAVFCTGLTHLWSTAPVACRDAASLLQLTTGMGHVIPVAPSFREFAETRISKALSARVADLTAQSSRALFRPRSRLSASRSCTVLPTTPPLRSLLRTRHPASQKLVLPRRPSKGEVAAAATS